MLPLLLEIKWKSMPLLSKFARLFAASLDSGENIDFKHWLFNMKYYDCFDGSVILSMPVIFAIVWGQEQEKWTDLCHK